MPGNDLRESGRNDLVTKNHLRPDAATTRQVLEIVAARGVACRACGSPVTEVNDALEMGTIWPGEELGAYMIALTCQTCGTPTGIRLHESEFLERDR